MNRVAFISEHASPLAILEGVDNGGQNVYVAELSREFYKQEMPYPSPEQILNAVRKLLQGQPAYQSLVGL